MSVKMALESLLGVKESFALPFAAVDGRKDEFAVDIFSNQMKLSLPPLANVFV